MLDFNKILQGDVLEQLKKLPDKSVDMQITSPPYWALRDYKIEGQVGLENTFQEYLDKLIVIFREVKRVLKDSGTCWVNLGDTYWGGGNNRGSSEDNLSEKQFSNRGARGQVQIEWDKSYKRKFLCGIPMRFALKMIDDGWILRNVIIWHKPNAMPSSVKDRFNVDFEYLFFFTKNEDYYFETQYEPHKLDSIKRACRARTSDKLDDGQYSTSYKQSNSGYENMIERLENGEIRGVGANGRNKRTVWNIPTKGFSGAHFAIFPEALIETPIKAGCPEQICNKCGKPREKIIELGEVMSKGGGKKGAEGHLALGRNHDYNEEGMSQREHIEKGYSDCGCNAGFSKGIVMDIFFGSGTSGVVALKNNRDFIGIELNPEYVKIAENRLKPYLEQNKLEMK